MLSNDKIDKNLESEVIWPAEDLESVGHCPMCQSTNSELLFTGVKDWAFNCAPGSWFFYNCLTCKSLYLNPRPTKDSINKAYGKYYTHDRKIENNTFKTKLYNEFMFHKFGLNSPNRLNLKSKWWVPVFNPFIYRKFPLDQLISLPRGKILDIGCGNGDFLITAKLLGYSVYGLEIDLQAFSTACERGLDVWQGSYEMLDSINLKFDYIVCSHVIEHVHDPVHFLNTVFKVTKPSTTLMLAWPNPNSIVLKWFKKHWRGLEAPRHLCLPSLDSVIAIISKHGWSDISICNSPIHTFGPSIITKYGKQGLGTKILNKILFAFTSLIPMSKNQDIIEIVCRKNIRVSPEKGGD